MSNERPTGEFSKEKAQECIKLLTQLVDALPKRKIGECLYAVNELEFFIRAAGKNAPQMVN